MARSTLGGGLDVGEFWEDSQRKEQKESQSPFGTAVTGQMFGTARNYGKTFDGNPLDEFGGFSGGKRMAGAIFDDGGQDQLIDGLMDNWKSEVEMGINSLDYKGREIAQEVYNKAMEKAQDKAESKKKQGGFWNTIGTVASVAAPIIGLFCDERLKTDIAPLQASEVDDMLSQMAFAVKGIREHS